jgi:hypothetical protein
MMREVRVAYLEDPKAKGDGPEHGGRVQASLGAAIVVTKTASVRSFEF